jgi:hypothetical protein
MLRQVRKGSASVHSELSAPAPVLANTDSGASEIQQADPLLPQAAQETPLSAPSFAKPEGLDAAKSRRSFANTWCSCFLPKPPPDDGPPPSAPFFRSILTAGEAGIHHTGVGSAVPAYTSHPLPSVQESMCTNNVPNWKTALPGDKNVHASGKVLFVLRPPA